MVANDWWCCRAGLGTGGCCCNDFRIVDDSWFDGYIMQKKKHILCFAWGLPDTKRPEYRTNLTQTAFSGTTPFGCQKQSKMVSLSKQTSVVLAFVRYSWFLKTIIFQWKRTPPISCSQDAHGWHSPRSWADQPGGFARFWFPSANQAATFDTFLRLWRASKLQLHTGQATLEAKKI